MLHWKIITLICCAQRSPKVTLITIFVGIVEWKQARWPPLFITFLISPCLVTTTYQVSSEIYGRVLLLGNHLRLSISPQEWIADLFFQSPLKSLAVHFRRINFVGTFTKGWYELSGFYVCFSSWSGIYLIGWTFGIDFNQWDLYLFYSLQLPRSIETPCQE